MIRIPRWLVSILATLFGAFHAGLGVWAIDTYQDPVLATVAVALYLIATFATMIFYRGPDLPMAQAIFNLAVAAVIPLLINSHLDPFTADAYSTWYVIGVATLMAATAVRQHKFIAWLGTGLMVVQVILWEGLFAGIQSGLIGAVLLVFAGHTISVGLKNAYQKTMEFTRQAIETQAQQEANSAASAERSTRLENALKGALPMLTKIKNQNGLLTAEEKSEARVLEAVLRDEIRGRGLMTPFIREAVKLARQRGVEVVVLDEGGLDEISAARKQEILFNVAEAISKVESGRVTLRAPADESWRVTLVATRPGIAKPDVWLKF